jgi:hypothetical protein
MAVSIRVDQREDPPQILHFEIVHSHCQCRLQQCLLLAQPAGRLALCGVLHRPSRLQLLHHYCHGTRSSVALSAHSIVRGTERFKGTFGSVRPQVGFAQCGFEAFNSLVLDPRFVVQLLVHGATSCRTFLRAFLRNVASATSGEKFGVHLVDGIAISYRFVQRASEGVAISNELVPVSAILMRCVAKCDAEALQMFERHVTLYARSVQGLSIAHSP